MKCGHTHRYAHMYKYTCIIEFYTAVRKMKLSNFQEEMELENIKWGNPGLERQMSHIILYMWIIVAYFYICISVRDWVCIESRKLERDPWEEKDSLGAVDHIWYQSRRGYCKWKGLKCWGILSARRRRRGTEGSAKADNVWTSQREFWTAMN